MTWRIAKRSGDVIVEAGAPDPGSTLVELGKALSAVLTGSAPLREGARQPISAHASDPAALVVAYLNELIVRFDDEGTLVSGGTLQATPPGRPVRVSGTLGVDRFDRARHAGGTEVKAATYHDLRFEAGADGWHARVLLDL